jgi:hypothetical protein
MSESTPARVYRDPHLPKTWRVEKQGRVATNYEIASFSGHDAEGQARRFVKREFGDFDVVEPPAVPAATRDLAELERCRATLWRIAEYPSPPDEEWRDMALKLQDWACASLAGTGPLLVPGDVKALHQEVLACAEAAIGLLLRLNDDDAVALVSRLRAVIAKAAHLDPMLGYRAPYFEMRDGHKVLVFPAEE